MAITLEQEALTQAVAELEHQLARQDVGLDNFILACRLKEDAFAYKTGQADLSYLTGNELQEKSPLAAAIFQHKPDRDVLLVSQPKFAIDLLGQGKEVEPVLDDLPQIVGLKCKICDGNDQEKVLEILTKHDAVLLDNFKLNQKVLLVLAPSIDRALAASLIVEKSAQAMVQSTCIGGYNKLPAWICLAYRKAYLTSYSKMDAKNKSLGPDDFDRQVSDRELALRQELVAAGNRLVEENLTLGTWGNLSLRLDDKFMLITPSGLAYDRLSPYDMVRVNYQDMTHEGSLKPSIEKGFHAAIYRGHPDINAVIHTHSFNCSVFAAAGQALPIVLPEAEMTLGHKTAFVPYYKPGTDQLAKAVASAVTDDIWAVIMGSHGMACCGADMEDVFHRTHLLEKSASYYVRCHLKK